MKNILANLGLSTSCDLSRGTAFSIYLGRAVKVNGVSYQYIMELPLTFVGKRNGINNLKRTRTERKPNIVNALISNDHDRFTIKKCYISGLT